MPPMPPTPPEGPELPTAEQRLQRRTLLLLRLAVTLAFAWILLPFYGTLLWSVIIAMLFAPVQRWLLQRLPGRPNVAALITLALVVVIVIVPMVAVLAALADQSAALYAGLKSGEIDPERFLRHLFAVLPRDVLRLLASLGLQNVDALQRSLAEAVARWGHLAAGEAMTLGQNAFDLVASLCITTYLAFFLIRDGAAQVPTLRRLVPLAPPHQRALLARFATVIRATVKGNLLVAVIQGALGGLAFWWLDVGGALLWAVLMAFLSLLPAIGAALVWAPVALYLLLAGNTSQALALLAWGVLVIGLVDNLLRPLLVGRDVRMPDSLVLISTLGGMATFGIHGFVLGPVIAAMCLAVWHLHGADAPPPPQSPPPAS